MEITEIPKIIKGLQSRVRQLEEGECRKSNYAPMIEDRLVTPKEAMKMISCGKDRLKAIEVDHLPNVGVTDHARRYRLSDIQRYIKNLGRKNNNKGAS